MCTSDIFANKFEGACNSHSEFVGNRNFLILEDGFILLTE